MQEIFSRHHVSKDQMCEVANAIAREIPRATVLLMEGEMGAGKTTLTKDIIAAMGSDDIVSSPTFSLVNHYITRSGSSIYHFDFYRIDDVEEAYDMGCEEYLYSGDTCIVEWGERVKEILPPDAWVVEIKKNQEDRDITLYRP